jgi:hypothetical protein
MWVLFLLFGASVCLLLYVFLREWFRKRLVIEFDRGFRAGLNPEAGGWVYFLGCVESESMTLPPEPANAPGCFLPRYR